MTTEATTHTTAITAEDIRAAITAQDQGDPRTQMEIAAELAALRATVRVNQADRAQRIANHLGHPMHAVRTVGDRYANELGRLADALEARDWDTVGDASRSLQHVEKILGIYGADADWGMAMIGRKVIR